MSVNNTNPQNNPSAHRMSSSQFQLSHYAAAQARAQAIAHAQSNALANHAQFQAQFQSHGITFNQPHGALGTSSPPGTGSGGKRASQKPLGRPPGVSNANGSSPNKSMEVMPVGRPRKKQKGPGKSLYPKVAAILPQSTLYTQLLELESRVDAVIMRKKTDIQEAIKDASFVQKTLRIYVFNTFANQISTVPKNSDAEPPYWSMKIIGRILEDGMDPDQAGLMAKPNPMYPMFSSFFKRVTISLDEKLYPDNHMIVWDSSIASTPHEGFEVKRKGDKEFSVHIRLELNYLPERFKLSSELMDVLGIEVDTRTRIIAAIWQYIKARKLQNADDPSYFNCDPPLLKVFGEQKVKFSIVSQKISDHLSKPQPIHLEHKLKLSGNSPAGDVCYDIKVDVPLLAQKDLNALLANNEKTKEIDACDEAIRTTIRKINEHRKRRAFFLGFSESPVEFIDALIESQGRDLELLAGNANRDAEKESQADFYTQPWVEDAVMRYLNRGPAKIAHKSST